MKAIGVVLVIAGLIGTVFGLTFDPTVSTGSFGRVNNIGLLNDKQNIIFVSGVVAIIGTLVLLLGGRSISQSSEVEGSSVTLSSLNFRTCPYCAEKIKTTAILCRLCGKESPAVSIALEHFTSDAKAVRTVENSVVVLRSFGYEVVQPREGKWEVTYPSRGTDYAYSAKQLSSLVDKLVGEQATRGEGLYLPNASSEATRKSE